MRKHLRKAIWNDKPLADQSLDLRDIFERIPDVEIKVHTGLYNVGMALKVAGKPIAIELIRCRNPQAPKVPVANGAAVSFDLATNGDALITAIQGLTAGTATNYEFTFRITYGDD
jgi:hypothetical protein